MTKLWNSISRIDWKGKKLTFIGFGFIFVCTAILFTNVDFSNDPEYKAFIQQAINSGLYTANGMQIRFEWASLGPTIDGKYSEWNNTVYFNTDRGVSPNTIQETLEVANHELGHAWWSANSHWLGEDVLVKMPDQTTPGHPNVAYDSETYATSIDVQMLRDRIATQVELGDYVGAIDSLGQLQFRESIWVGLSRANEQLFGTTDYATIVQGLITGGGSYNGLSITNGVDARGNIDPSRILLFDSATNEQVFNRQYFGQKIDLSTSQGLVSAAQAVANSISIKAQFSYDGVSTLPSTTYAEIISGGRTALAASQALNAQNAVSASENQEVYLYSDPTLFDILTEDYISYDY